MSLLPLVLKTKSFASFKKRFEKGELAHANLIVCNDKIFLKEFVVALATVAVCKNGGCFDCTTCAKVEKNNHVDVVFFPKEKDAVVVEDVERLISDSFVKPFESNKKVFCLPFCDTMNLVAQNKLLKTLEEPPSNVFVFLGVVNDSTVLTTIKSRCQKFFVPDFSTEEIAEFLMQSGFDLANCQLAAAMSFGKVSKAMALVSDSVLPQILNAVLGFFQLCLSSKDVAEHVSKLSVFQGRETELFESMLIVLREMAIAQSCEQLLLLKAKKDDILVLSRSFSCEAIVVCIEKVNESKRKVDSFVKLTSVLDNLVLEILEVKHKCPR